MPGKLKFEPGGSCTDKNPKMVTVSSSSPYHQHSSPYSLSFLLEQHHNQCVPSSPSLSPFFRQHGALTQKQLLPSSSTRAGSSPAAAQVPELLQGPGENASNTASSGSRAVYSGSPLLRQILRVGRKRQYEGEGSSPLIVSAGGSPSPSPGSNSKRARLDSPGSRVPNSVIIVERKQSYYKKSRGMEQVVPNTISPLERRRKVPASGVEGSTRSELSGCDASACQRRLPTSKEGVKPLNLFSGDEIFPNHNEE